VSAAQAPVHYADGSYELTAKSNARFAKKRRLQGGSHEVHVSPLELWSQREISRDVDRNSQLASGALETIASNVIQSGFRIRIPRGIDDAARAAQQKRADNWERWCDLADARRRLHLWDLMALAEVTELRDGDVFFLLDPAGNRGRGRVHVIEGDRVLTPRGYSPSAGRVCYHGVECDAGSGQLLRVFVAREAPMFPEIDEARGHWYRIFDDESPADGGIVMSCMPRRVSATRGEPILGPAIREHDDIDAVLVAVRIALRQAASRSTYSKIEQPDEYLAWLRENNISVSDDDLARGAVEPLEPGSHEVLGLFESVGVVENNMPGNNFVEFVETELRMLGLGRVQLPIELLMLDWSKRSFSSARMAVEEARRRFRLRQVQVARYKATPIWDFFVGRMQALGELTEEEANYEHSWRFPRWAYIDPLKDAKTAILLRRERLASTQQLVAERGDDYDDLIDDLAYEDAHAVPHERIGTTSAGTTERDGDSGER
jgi:capsid protein